MRGLPPIDSPSELRGCLPIGTEVDGLGTIVDLSLTAYLIQRPAGVRVDAALVRGPRQALPGRPSPGVRMSATESHPMLANAPEGAVAWKYADPLEKGRYVFDVDEARKIALEDPTLIVWASGDLDGPLDDGWIEAAYGDDRCWS